MVGVGRGNDQHIGIRQTRDKSPRITSRDDHHLVSHACLREHVAETRWRERLCEPPRLDCKAVWRAMRGENQKENILLGIQALGYRLQRPGQSFDRCISAFLRIVLHVGWASLETTGYDLSCARRLGSEHVLIAEQAKGHNTHLSSVLNSMYRRNQRPDRQKKSDERRAEPLDRGPGGHERTLFRDRRYRTAAQHKNSGKRVSFHPSEWHAHGSDMAPKPSFSTGRAEVRLCDPSPTSRPALAMSALRAKPEVRDRRDERLT